MKRTADRGTLREPTPNRCYHSASLARAITEGRTENESSWWWNRFTAADEIAARAARRFETSQ